MKQKALRLSCFVLALVFMLQSAVAYSASVDLVSKEQLKNVMETGKAVVVDVRKGRDWKSSEFKIKGAIRPDKELASWAAQYPKDTQLVLYCA